MSLVIGNFDGVHRGHQALLAAAGGAGRRVEALTFWPHPMRVLRPERAPKLLCGLSERISYLSSHGAAHVHVCEFTPRLAEQSAERFARELLSPLAPAHIFVGENFRFGHGAQGDSATLAGCGFEVTALPLVRLPDGPVSSTVIRGALGVGDVDRARRCLGRHFRFSGVVTQGFRRGRTLGFPTANLFVPPELMLPSDGVYAGWLSMLDGETEEAWPAAISVGTNPTFGDAARTVEAHVIGQSGLDLYGRPAAVDFGRRLRGMVKFDSIDELVTQMHLDIAQSRLVLAELAESPIPPGACS